MKNKNKNRNVIFLDKDQELKIVLSTIPHTYVYIKNENGVLKITDSCSFKKNMKKDG